MNPNEVLQQRADELKAVVEETVAMISTYNEQPVKGTSDFRPVADQISFLITLANGLGQVAVVVKQKTQGEQMEGLMEQLKKGFSKDRPRFGGGLFGDAD